MARKGAKRNAGSANQETLAIPGDQVELQFDGATLNLFQAPHGAAVADYSVLDPRSLDSVTSFVRQGLYLPILFEEDNGCTARFRLGDANEQEAEEWVGRVISKLDLRSGRLGCNEAVLAVPAGEYQVEVCVYLPSTSATRILSLLADKKHEALWDYWMRTHPGEMLPYWMVEAATSQDDEVVPPELLPPDDQSDPFQKVKVKVGGKLRKLPRSNPVRFIDVVVRLTPLKGASPDPLIAQEGFCWGGRKKPKTRPVPSAQCFLLWEGRKPPRCPTGFPSERFVA
jgi:hypothetical protein